MPLDMSHDWSGRPLPENIQVSDDCFIQSALMFSLFRSGMQPGLVMGHGSGIYSESQVVVGPAGRVEIGDYACLNSTSILCEQSISIGRHCLLAWGSVVTDCSFAHGGAWAHAAQAKKHWPLDDRDPRPVVLEDNVWIGFEAVILPGVRIGEGSIIGSKTVIDADVPPYSIMAGSPPRLVRTLRPETPS